ncbi:hypothetical protein [Ostreiculturibacter nitratireducens]|uniref:hypothetical protein n=1 Tax=Ostreiculturibacter nitratireducens TaxID=3075226 RepID=UPI0031B57B6B
MFEYDTSHLAASHPTAAARTRHGIARKDYQDRKAERVLREDALRRKARRSHLAGMIASGLAHGFRSLAGALGYPAKTGRHGKPPAIHT